MAKSKKRSGSKSVKKRKSAKSSKSSKKGKSSKLACAPGEIVRSGYKRRAHDRKAYNKKTKSGKRVHIKSSHVRNAKVGKACTPAKGKAIVRGFKTPESQKVLPPVDPMLKLRKLGYETHKSAAARHAALHAATRRYGELKTLRHLNLIRNYNADPTAKAILTKDVEYL